MLFIYRFRRGFLRIEIRGDIAEALLNICVKNGIPLWSIKRQRKRYQELYFGKRFQALACSCCGKRTRVHILARYGLPFFTERYKERLGIPVGAALFFAFLSFMSGFVWSVGVEGNSAISKNELLAEAETSAFMRACVKAIYRPQAQSCNYCFGITAFHGALLISRAAI